MLLFMADPSTLESPACILVFSPPHMFFLNDPLHIMEGGKTCILRNRPLKENMWGGKKPGYMEDFLKYWDLP
jgi:hypothetical protein